MSLTAHPPASTSATNALWRGHMADDLGSTFGPEPLASLSASAEELVLTGTRGTYRVPKSAVTKIGRGALYPWFFAAIRIHHRLPDVSRELQFKPLEHSRPEILRELTALGYPVR